MRGIAVSFSGEGHRIALFGLGVLPYLIRTGKHAAVGSVASVSGGSQTNGCIAKVILDYTLLSVPRGDRFETLAGSQ